MTSTQANIQITDPKLGTFVVPYAPLAERLPLFLLDDEAPMPKFVAPSEKDRYRAVLAATATVIQLEQMLNDIQNGEASQIQKSKGMQRTMLRNRLAETNPKPTLEQFAARYAKVLLDVEWHVNRYNTPHPCREGMVNTMSVIKLGHAPAIAAAASGYGWVRKDNSPGEIAVVLADAFEAELAE